LAAVFPTAAEDDLLRVDVVAEVVVDTGMDKGTHHPLRIPLLSKINTICFLQVRFVLALAFNPECFCRTQPLIEGGQHLL
jgi:hypothetical protein